LNLSTALHVVNVLRGNTLNREILRIKWCKVILVVKVRYFDYKNALSVLKEKGLLSELEGILHGIADIDYKKI